MDVDTVLDVVAMVAAALLLVIATAAEASLVYLSRSRARALAGRGGARAGVLHRYIHERMALRSSLRLAHNVAFLLAAAIVVAITIDRYGGGLQSITVAALLLIVAVGLVEGLPEATVSRNPERWALLLSPITVGLRLVFWLPAQILDFPGRWLARYTPQPESGPDEEEHEKLLRLVEMEESNGGIEQEERQMIRGVIKLVDTTAREIMVPRIDVAAVEAGASMRDVERVIVERGFSRIPLYEETIDNVVGVIYAKDVLRHLAEGSEPPSLKALARPPYFIPESKKVDELLTELRQTKVHIAIVVDEYGGTAGLVTTEDILEEIVGEIEDEYDVEEAAVLRVSESEAVVDARIGIDALNEMFDLELPNEDYDTVGGIIFAKLGRVPVAGDEVRIDGIRLHVLSVIGRRIKKIRVTRLEAEPAST